MMCLLIVRRQLAKLIVQKNLFRMYMLMSLYSRSERQTIVSGKVKNKSILYIAIEQQDVYLVNYVLDECEADPNDIGYENGIDSPCLWKAVDLNNLQIASTLLKHGADVNGANSYMTTPLLTAVIRTNFDMVHLLTSNGADVNSANYEGLTCLMASISEPAICRYLLELKANVNVVNNQEENVLMLAMRELKNDSILMLANAGENLRLTNSRGENSVFLTIWLKYELSTDHFDFTNPVFINSAAIALEAICCMYTVRGYTDLAEIYWRRALQTRKLPEDTPLYTSGNREHFRTHLQPFVPLLNDRDVQAVMFMESIFGSYSHGTINLLKEASSHITTLVGFVRFLETFIQFCSSAGNDEFFRLHTTMADLVYICFSKGLPESNMAPAILKYLSGHIEDGSKRLSSMNDLDKLAKASEIISYNMIVLRFISAFAESRTGDLDQLGTYVSKIVQLEFYGMQKLSLLHLCIMNDYPVNVATLLLRCGANVNGEDDLGCTPLHYALKSTGYCTRQVIALFFQYGLRLDQKSTEYSCFGCVLIKKDLLEKHQHLHYTSLQCLTAKMAAQKCHLRNVVLPKTFEIMLASHLDI